MSLDLGDLGKPVPGSQMFGADNTVKFDTIMGMTDEGRPIFQQDNGLGVSRMGITVESDGIFYEVPSIDPENKRVMTPDEALSRALETGEATAFGTQKEADDYSKMMSQYLSTGQDVFVANPQHAPVNTDYDPFQTLELLGPMDESSARENLIFDEPKLDRAARGLMKLSNRFLLNNIQMLDHHLRISGNVADFNPIGGVPGAIINATGENFLRIVNQTSEAIEKDGALEETLLRAYVPGYDDYNLTDPYAWLSGVANNAEFGLMMASFPTYAGISTVSTYSTALEESDGNQEFALGSAAIEGAMHAAFFGVGKGAAKGLKRGFDDAMARGGRSATMLPEAMPEAVKIRFGRAIFADLKAAAPVISRRLRVASERKFGKYFTPEMLANTRAVAPSILRSAFAGYAVMEAARISDELLLEGFTRFEKDFSNNIDRALRVDLYTRIVEGFTAENAAAGIGMGLLFFGAPSIRASSRAFKSGRSAQREFMSELARIHKMSGKRANPITPNQASIMEIQAYDTFKQDLIMSLQGQKIDVGISSMEDARLFGFAKDVIRHRSTLPKSRRAEFDPVILRLKNELNKRGITSEGTRIRGALPETIPVRPATMPDAPGVPRAGMRRGMVDPSLIGLGAKRSMGIEKSGAPKKSVPGTQPVEQERFFTAVNNYGAPTAADYMAKLQESGFDTTKLEAVNLPDSVVSYAAMQVANPFANNVVIPAGQIKKALKIGVDSELDTAADVQKAVDAYVENYEKASVTELRQRAGSMRDSIFQIEGGSPIQRLQNTDMFGIDPDARLTLSEFVDKGAPGWQLKQARIEKLLGTTLAEGDVERISDQGDVGRQLVEDLQNFVEMSFTERATLAYQNMPPYPVPLSQVIGEMWVDKDGQRYRRGETELSLVGEEIVEKKTREKIPLDKIYTKGSALFKPGGSRAPEGYTGQGVLNTATALPGSVFTLYGGRATLVVGEGLTGILEMHQMPPLRVSLEQFIPVDMYANDAQMAMTADQARTVAAELMARADGVKNPKLKSELEATAADILGLNYKKAGRNKAGEFVQPKTLQEGLELFNAGIVDADYIASLFRPKVNRAPMRVREQERTHREGKELEEYRRLGDRLRAEARGARNARVGFEPRKKANERVRDIRNKLLQDLRDFKYDVKIAQDSVGHLRDFVMSQKDIPKSVREQILGQLRVGQTLDFDKIQRVFDRAEIKILQYLEQRTRRELFGTVRLTRSLANSNPNKSGAYALLPKYQKLAEEVLGSFPEPVGLYPASQAARTTAETLVNSDVPHLVEHGKEILQRPTGSALQFRVPKKSTDPSAYDNAIESQSELRDQLFSVIETNNAEQQKILATRRAELQEVELNTRFDIEAAALEGLVPADFKAMNQLMEAIDRSIGDKSFSTLMKYTSGGAMSMGRLIELMTARGDLYNVLYRKFTLRDRVYNRVDMETKQGRDALMISSGITTQLQNKYGKAYNGGNDVGAENKITVNYGKDADGNNLSVPLSSAELVYIATISRASRAVGFIDKAHLNFGPQARFGKDLRVKITTEFLENIEVALKDLGARLGFDLLMMAEGNIAMFNNSSLAEVSRESLVQQHNRAGLQSMRGLKYVPIPRKSAIVSEDPTGMMEGAGFTETELSAYINAADPTMMTPINDYGLTEDKSVLGATVESKADIVMLEDGPFYERRAQAQLAQFTVIPALAEIRHAVAGPTNRGAGDSMISISSQSIELAGFGNIRKQILDRIEAIALGKAGKDLTQKTTEEKLLRKAQSIFGIRALTVNPGIAVSQVGSEMFYDMYLPEGYRFDKNRPVVSEFMNTLAGLQSAFKEIIPVFKSTGRALGTLLPDNLAPELPTMRETAVEAGLGNYFDFFYEHSMSFRKTATSESGIQIFSGQTAAELEASARARKQEDALFDAIQSVDGRTRLRGGKRFVQADLDNVLRMLKASVKTVDGLQPTTKNLTDAFGIERTGQIFAELNNALATKTGPGNPTQEELINFVTETPFEALRASPGLTEVIISKFDEATQSSQPNFDYSHLTGNALLTRKNLYAYFFMPFRGYLNAAYQTFVTSAGQARAANRSEQFVDRRKRRVDQYVEEQVEKDRKAHDKNQEGVPDDAKVPFDEATSRAKYDGIGGRRPAPNTNYKNQAARALFRIWFGGFLLTLMKDVVSAILNPTQQLTAYKQMVEEPGEYVKRTGLRYGLGPVTSVASIFPIAGIGNSLLYHGFQAVGLGKAYPFKPQTVPDALVEDLLAPFNRARKKLAPNVFTDSKEFDLSGFVDLTKGIFGLMGALLSPYAAYGVTVYQLDRQIDPLGQIENVEELMEGNGNETGGFSY